MIYTSSKVALKSEVRAVGGTVVGSTVSCEIHDTVADGIGNVPKLSAASRIKTQRRSCALP